MSEEDKMFNAQEARQLTNQNSPEGQANQELEKVLGKIKLFAGAGANEFSPFSNNSDKHTLWSERCEESRKPIQRAVIALLESRGFTVTRVSESLGHGDYINHYKISW